VTPELEQSSVSGDLVAIAQALAQGLRHYEAGSVTEALWWWQFSYLSNWGSTASSVLRALHSVVSHVRLDTDLDETVKVEDRLLAETVAEAHQHP
jgi:hypothetical protein